MADDAGKMMFKAREGVLGVQWLLVSRALAWMKPCVRRVATSLPALREGGGVRDRFYRVRVAAFSPLQYAPASVSAIYFPPRHVVQYDRGQTTILAWKSL